ncbi:unnamed protein product [Rhizophagus irregularis]|nr:unnamed protein product [Rhizophagus irregularis]
MINRKKRLSINVTHLEVDKPKQMTGANMLYSTHKSTSYALLDFNSLRKDNTQLQVFTNNKRVIERYKSPYEISSDRKNVNVKFRISKYLTAKLPKIPLKRAIFKEKTHESMKQIYSAQSGISYMKQLAFEGRKSYERPSLKLNSHSAYNELTEDIFLNHTFNEDDFVMIRAFKEDTLPKKKIATKEDYDMMHHIFTKCNLSVAEAADHKYKCSRYDIVYDMKLIDQ